MPKKTKQIDTGIEHRSALVNREHIDIDARTVEIAFSSENPVERFFGKEILDHARSSVRVGRMNDSAPVLMGHNAHDTDDHVGVVESVTIGADRVGRAVVRFGKSKRARGVFDDVVDGIRPHVSVGYRIHKLVLEEQNDDNDIYRAIDWEPYEISFVSIPADHTVGVGRHSEKTFKTEIIMPEPKKDEVVADDDQTRSAPVATPAAWPEVSVVTPSADDVRRDELARITEIESLGEMHCQPVLARQYSASGASVEEFRVMLLEKIGKAKPVAQGDADIGLTDKEVRSYSFVRVLNALANPNNKGFQESAAFEFEASAAAAARMGNTPKGVYVPGDVFKRDLTVAGSAGNLVSTDLLTESFIDILENSMVLNALGATLLRDLVGNVAIPRMTAGATAYWVAEDGSITESQQTFDQVTLTPKTVGAMTEITRKTLLQSSLDIEAFVRRDLAQRLALAIDSQGIIGDGASNNPTGILSTTGIGSVTFAASNDPTFGEVIDVESAVAIDNALLGKLSYLAPSSLTGAMKQKVKDAGSGRYIIEGGEANGYPVVQSNAVTAATLIFGNFQDILLGFWGGLDLNIDTSTGSASGRVRVVALQDVDVAVRHAESFAVGNGGV